MPQARHPSCQELRERRAMRRVENFRVARTQGKPRPHVAVVTSAARNDLVATNGVEAREGDEIIGIEVGHAHM